MAEELAEDHLHAGDGVCKQQMQRAPFRLAECFDAKTNRCVVTGSCGLYGKLNEALGAFFAVLDRYTIADVLAESPDIPAIYEERLTAANVPMTRPCKGNPTS